MGLLKFLGYRIIVLILIIGGVFLLLTGFLAMIFKSAINMIICFIVGGLMILSSAYYSKRGLGK